MLGHRCSMSGSHFRPMALQYCLGLFRVVSLDCRDSIRLIEKSGPQEHPDLPQGEREHLAVAMITREIIYNLTSNPNHQIQFFDPCTRAGAWPAPGNSTLTLASGCIVDTWIGEHRRDDLNITQRNT